MMKYFPLFFTDCTKHFGGKISNGNPKSKLLVNSSKLNEKFLTLSLRFAPLFFLPQNVKISSLKDTEPLQIPVHHCTTEMNFDLVNTPFFSFGQTSTLLTRIHIGSLRNSFINLSLKWCLHCNIQ